MARGKLMFTERDATRAVKAVRKAGCSVARVEFDREGKIVVVTESLGAAIVPAEDWPEGAKL